MKKNIIILTILTFLCLSGLLYGFVEIVYNERVSLQETSSESNTVSFIELISPEIKTAVMKDDDIALLYSIEKLSKVKTVKEAFILDKDLNVVIHNDSSKWNKNMWKEQSDKVLVIIRFKDGTKVVTTGETHDGKWYTTISRTLDPVVTHWMQMPEPAE